MPRSPIRMSINCLFIIDNTQTTHSFNPSNLNLMACISLHFSIVLYDELQICKPCDLQYCTSRSDIVLCFHPSCLTLSRILDCSNIYNTKSFFFFYGFLQYLSQQISIIYMLLSKSMKTICKTLYFSNINPLNIIKGSFVLLLLQGVSPNKSRS